MSASALALLLLCAAPAPASRGRELARGAEWVELYLAYSAADPKQYNAADRRELGALLLKGARALDGNDPVMAFSLAERAAAFDETADALLLVARAAMAAEQRGSAESALRRGLEKFPHHGPFGLELGRLLLEEKDARGALAALEKIPAKAKERREAGPLIARARAQLEQEQIAERQARTLERRIDGTSRTASATRSETNWESGVGPGGMRIRANSRFVFRYFNAERDFGQRAEYEGKVAEALNDAWRFTRRILGRAREAPVDVVLYTREEFATHHGALMAMSVAGFYGDGAIRMNDAAEWNAQTRATLVHEYVHAAVDEFAGGNADRVPRWVNEGLAEYVQWRFLGSENPPWAVAKGLQAAALQGALPTLESMTHRALIARADPALAYGTSAIAVRHLLRQGGVPELLAFIADVGAGAPVEQVLRTRYGTSLARLDEHVRDELKGR